MVLVKIGLGMVIWALLLFMVAPFTSSIRHPDRAFGLLLLSAASAILGIISVLIGLIVTLP